MCGAFAVCLCSSHAPLCLDSVLRTLSVDTTTLVLGETAGPRCTESYGHQSRCFGCVCNGFTGVCVPNSLGRLINVTSYVHLEHSVVHFSQAKQPGSSMHTSQSMSRQNTTNLIHKQRAMFSTPLTSRSQAKPGTSCKEDLVKTIANQGETDLKTSECPNRCRPPRDPIHQLSHPYSLCFNSQIECGLHANQVLSALAAHRTSHCRAMPGPSVALHYLSVGEALFVRVLVLRIPSKRRSCLECLFLILFLCLCFALSLPLRNRAKLTTPKAS